MLCTYLCFWQSPLEDLVLANAEAMKQFEYLEKSLVSFREIVSEQAAELRQVCPVAFRTHHTHTRHVHFKYNTVTSSTSSV